MPVITFIGAGSLGFTRNLVRDLLSVSELAGSEIRLQDIDDHQLGMVAQLIQRDIDHNGVAARLVSTTDQAAAVTGADYVVNTARVGGLEAFTHDVEIPLGYGVDQCVGDTLCAGGIMYGQRGIPMILALCRDIRERAASDCLLLNYANPMAMLTWAANAYGGVRCIGLCHGVQGGHALIAKALDLPKDEIDIVCAGINHQTWYVQVSHRGRDLTGELLPAMEAHPDIAATEQVRIDMLRRFGYLSTESNGHLSEYLAWYRKRPEEIARWISTATWIHGETAGYLRVCTERRNWFETDFPNMLAEPPHAFAEVERSEEHGSYIIEALETGRIYRHHFNTVNRGTIGNLPDDAVIESPGFVDRLGVHMAPVGDLPLGCAAVCNQSISVQRLAVAAAVHGDIELLRQAMLLDPLVGAVCNPPEVWQLVDDLLIAQAEWLPQYRAAIEAARRRQASGERIPTRAGRGAVRREVQSVAAMQRDAAAHRERAGKSDLGRVSVAQR